MFRSTEDEIRELAAEIREIKELLRTISNKVSQMESRAKRAFPSVFPKRESGAKVRSPKVTDPPTISPQEALSLFENLLGVARKEGKEVVQHRLEEIALPDLLLLSQELGVSLGKKKPTKKTLQAGIIGRINESLLLSTAGLRNHQQEHGGIPQQVDINEESPNSLIATSNRQDAASNSLQCLEAEGNSEGGPSNGHAQDGEAGHRQRALGDKDEKA